MKSMMKKYTHILVLLLFAYMPRIAIGGLEVQCPQAKIQALNGQTIIFGEHEFENGVHDLVISSIEKPEIKRVTYSGKNSLKSTGAESCIYQSVAIAQGGDWGWHLAWVFNTKSGVYYSRMDGEAWVSTPAKRISEEHADVLQFAVQDERLTLRGYAGQNSKAAIFSLTSEDEGRNW